MVIKCVNTETATFEARCSCHSLEFTSAERASLGGDQTLQAFVAERVATRHRPRASITWVVVLLANSAIELYRHCQFLPIHFSSARQNERWIGIGLLILQCGALGATLTVTDVHIPWHSPSHAPSVLWKGAPREKGQNLMVTFSEKLAESQ
jgi:hypothetical protein